MTARVRCAVYTRKSSEEGLEQSFNSLDAQREACEAYIMSQRHEGWHVRFKNSGGTKDTFTYDPKTSIFSWSKTLDATAMTTRAMIPSQSTPANSSVACSAGQIWSDSSYIYVCTATNMIKRAELSAF